MNKSRKNCSEKEQIMKKNVQISILPGNFSKITKRPWPNKDILGGKLLKNNKNVRDYYSAHQSKDKGHLGVKFYRRSNALWYLGLNLGVHKMNLSFLSKEK